MEKVAFWFRRDLRLEDNTGLFQALNTGKQVVPVFIFDSAILDELDRDDARVSFIYQSLNEIHNQLLSYGSSLCIRFGEPSEVWKKLILEFDITSIYSNEDYEPYAMERDRAVRQLAKSQKVKWNTYKDQVIFGPNEVLKPSDGKPYTVYTPFKNRWLEYFKKQPPIELLNANYENLHRFSEAFPTIESFGFEKSKIAVKPYDLSQLENYKTLRDFPAADGTSYLSVHLRFGTVGVRQVIKQLSVSDEVFLSELIWREFFMQILYHFPQVVSQSFKIKYDRIPWRNNEAEFEKWKKGETGFPMVDAGMRQLNQTGYMHNRVRMVVASFLCKHLLIDWRWGESYFASKLLDYELASNNGNWQWAAGTGCDAAPYFRVFNPTEQLKKFDPQMEYIKRWVSEFVPPMVDHKAVRIRAINTYKKVLTSFDN
ncbi:MAG: deoxyribodipyrimidine photo-lyase [Reichenbachiella sp.]|uniref:cryptochrome/photolyase family protein n=1 Tax=Reichenbachiella sp. TaxID=2184521 RepID=UPI0032665841